MDWKQTNIQKNRLTYSRSKTHKKDANPLPQNRIIGVLHIGETKTPYFYILFVVRAME